MATGDVRRRRPGRAPRRGSQGWRRAIRVATERMGSSNQPDDITLPRIVVYSIVSGVVKSQWPSASHSLR